MEFSHIILPCLLLPLVLLDALNVSQEAFLAMEEYLKFLNRPAIHSIHTKYGDIFDCVDINKQPALDHPSLIDHKIQMRPSILPKEAKVKGTQMAHSRTMGLPGGGCPNGTIPIQRTQMEDLIRAKSLSNFGKKYMKDRNVLADQSLHRYATFRSMYNGNFTGSEAWMNVWSPPTADKLQFSLAQFWVSAGEDNELNTIESGWMVYPFLYGDQRSRLFVYWTADFYHKTGCYNLKCPGFVHISSKISLGVPISPVSTYNGTQYELDYRVMKDPGTGDWWLSIGDEAIGYWPKAIFTHLQENAEFVEWGGEVHNRNSIGIWPPMGSGHFAEEGHSKACYVREVKVFDSHHNVKEFPSDALVSGDKPCYTIADVRKKRRRFYFGGPGGVKC